MASETVQETTAGQAGQGHMERALKGIAKAETQYMRAGKGPSYGGIAVALTGLITLAVGMATPAGPIIGVALLAAGGASFAMGSRMYDKAKKNLRAAMASVAALQESAKPAAHISPSSNEDAHASPRAVVTVEQPAPTVAAETIRKEQITELPGHSPTHARNVSPSGKRGPSPT